MPPVTESLDDWKKRINSIYSMLTETENNSLPDDIVEQWHKDENRADEYQLIYKYMSDNKIPGKIFLK